MERCFTATALQSVSGFELLTGNVLGCRQTQGKTHPENIISCSEGEEEEGRRICIGVSEQVETLKYGFE